MKTFKNEHTALSDRLIPVVRQLKDYTMTEYAGYDDILFMPDYSKNTEKEVAEFLSLNDVWAAAIPKAQVLKQNIDLMQGSGYIFTFDVQDLYEKSLLKMAGADGFISSGMILPLEMENTIN